MINTKLLAQNSIWILQPYYTNAASITNQLTPLPIPIGLGTDPAICYQGQTVKNSANGIAMKVGSLFFFIVDEYIYNANGICIGFLRDLNLNYNTEQKDMQSLL